ncbi:MAG TPA: hypothetical protein VGM56_00785 [Byssovorax sp.]|jgi:hypothetical protein
MAKKRKQRRVEQDEAPESERPRRRAKSARAPESGLAALLHAYTDADPRALGAFRVAFGLLMIADLLRHLPGLDAWFGPGAVASPAAIAAIEGPATPFSFYLLTTSLPVVGIMMAASLAVFVAYTLGYKTRLTQVLALVAIVSLHGRNDFIEHAGERTVNVLALLTAFLPLGRRYSLDALARCRGGADAPLDVTPVRSAAFTVLLLQFAAAYALDWSVKTGPGWTDGTALIAATEPMVGTHIGIVLRDSLPIEVFRVMCLSTLFIESALALLLLIPYAGARAIAFGLTVALHAGIATFMALGVFQPSMFIAGMLFVPAFVFDRAERLGLLSPLAGVAAQARARFAALPARSPGAATPSWIASTREAVVIVLGLVLFLLVLADNRRMPAWVRPPREIARPARIALVRVGVFETWDHYADPRPVDGILVVDAVTVDGRHVDPMNEVACGLTGPPLDEVPHELPMSLLWWNLEKYAHEPGAPMLAPLGAWVARYAERTGKPEDAVVSYEVTWLVTQRTLRGQPVETSRHVLARWRSDGADDGS